jgi:thiamine biosynthesis protein ThiS
LLVKLNGESREVIDRSTLADLIKELSLTPARIAIEINQQVVRRDKWDDTILAAGDHIEIVHFVGGGIETVETVSKAVETAQVTRQ